MNQSQLDEIRDKLRNWMQQSISLPGESDPALTDLLSNEFIRENTEFGELDDFLKNAPIQLEGETLIGPEMDDFVDRNSDFTSWQELQQKAEVRWMKDQV